MAGCGCHEREIGCDCSEAVEGDLLCQAQADNAPDLAGNFLVCLAVWQALAAQDILGKIFSIFLYAPPA